MIQAGDPTATGEGGESVYEQDKEFETYDAEWARLLGREKGETIVFGDELHSRLKFGRRGLVGMAKGTGSGPGGGGGYGSQFFITLGDCRAQLDGKCTMFGRVEGEGIYNVVKISEGEVVEGTERPRYPFKITGGEVLQMPKGEAWEGLQRRVRALPAAVAVDEKKEKKKGAKKKAGKTLLSFGDEGDEDLAEMAAKPKKAKFNTRLISVGEDEEISVRTMKTNGTSGTAPGLAVQKRDHSPPRKPSTTSHRQRKSPSPVASAVSPPHSPNNHRRKPSFHDPTTQLPIRDPESPSNSPSPSPPPSRPAKATASTLNAEIAALKASMRRDVVPMAEPERKKSALEEMIPSTSIHGRKRRRPGDPGAGTGDPITLKILDAFKAKLEGVDREGDVDMTYSLDEMTQKNGKMNGHVESNVPKDEDEAALCDLHFIANCQSCSDWERNGEGLEGERAGREDENDVDWMTHSLSFAKDRLGKDLTWKRKNEEELVVIDPREKEKEIKLKEREKRRGIAGGGGGGGGGR